MATDAKPFLSPEDYLRIERAAEYKSEYCHGQMYAMSGGTSNRSRIAMNVSAELVTGLKGTPCHAFNSDLRIYIPATGMYTYPDVSVVCGEEWYLDQKSDTLLNPILLVEVLSPSAERYDRTDKFQNYRSLPSLLEYLTIAQDQMLVEQWHIYQGRWTLVEYKDSGQAVTLVSLDARLTVAEIYRDVNFPAP